VCASLPVFRRRDAHASPAVGSARFRAPGGVALAALGVAAAVVLAARMNAREAVTMAFVVALASLQWIVKRRSSRAS